MLQPKIALHHSATLPQFCSRLSRCFAIQPTINIRDEITLIPQGDAPLTSNFPIAREVVLRTSQAIAELQNITVTEIVFAAQVTCAKLRARHPFYRRQLTLEGIGRTTLRSDRLKDLHQPPTHL